MIAIRYVLVWTLESNEKYFENSAFSKLSWHPEKMHYLILTQLTSLSFKSFKVFDVSGFMAWDSSIFLTLSTYSDVILACTLMFKFGKEFKNLEPSAWKDKTAKTACTKPMKSNSNYYLLYQRN